jgi:ABC-type hemin transport system substrate-binding protein
MKKGKRTKHHHHRVNALLVQYAHLNAEQRLDAIEADIEMLAATIEGARAAQVLEKVAAKLRVHR